MKRNSMFKNRVLNSIHDLYYAACFFAHGGGTWDDLMHAFSKVKAAAELYEFACANKYTFADVRDISECLKAVYEFFKSECDRFERKGDEVRKVKSMLKHAKVSSSMKITFGSGVVR